ncbi:MAG: EpsG family protein [Tannerellaceae bacterium]|nr:EpsG family protein [Tannerellaceae bacterium]
MNRRSSYVFFFFFAVLWCLAITVNSGKSMRDMNDANVYRAHFERFHSYTNNDISKITSTYFDFSKNDKIKDIYAQVIIYYLSHITDNYHVMFMVFGAICAFFMLKSFHFFTRERNFTTGIQVFLLTTMFIVHNSIFLIFGVRFITATWIGVYCIFQIFINHKKKYFFLLSITPLIHIAFFTYIVLVCMVYFAKNRNVVLITLFIFSLVFSNFSIFFSEKIMNFLPTVISHYAFHYSSEGVITKIKTANALLHPIVQFLYILQYLYINVIVCMFIANRKVIISTIAHFPYIFVLLIMIFVNFTKSIPSMERYMNMVFIFIPFIWLICKNNFQKYRWLLYSYPLIFMYRFYYIFAIEYTRATPWEFYVSSPFYLVYKYLITMQ